MTSHPAKFSAPILEVLRPLLAPHRRLLDPFAGTGAGLDLHPGAWGVEIEPEWAAMHPRNVLGDATALPFRDSAFDCVFTSPCYGNRMADHHEARDGSRRYTYRHVLGRRLHENSAGRMQWGDAYRHLHEVAWREARRVLRPFGTFILNISNHVRAGRVINVAGWHCAVLESLGFVEVDRLEVPTQRLRNGQNHDLRVDHELVVVYLRRAW